MLRILQVIGLILLLFSSCLDGTDRRRNWAQLQYGMANASNEVELMQYKDSATEIIVKSNDFNKIIPLSKLISEYKYVPLETSKECLIGVIDKIIVKNNRIYILDQLQAESIFIYDWKGKLINLINKRGEGPGEYRSLDDLYVQNDGTVIVFDSDGQKVIKYDEEGNLIGEKRVAFYFSYMSGLGPDFYFSTNYSSQNFHLTELHCYNLLHCDSNLSIKQKALPYDEKNLLLRTASGSDFFQTDTLLYYHPFLGDTIYQIQASQLVSRYTFKFDEKLFSRTNLEDKEVYDAEIAVNLFHSANENENYLMHPMAFSSVVDFFQISRKEKLFSIFYSKKEKKAYPGNKVDVNGIENCIAYSDPVTAYGNYLIGYVQASIFVESWNHIKKHPNYMISRSYPEYNKIQKDDNPVIFFAECK